MFSCCALFAQADDSADIEHLKELDEVDATAENDISITIDGEGLAGSSDYGGTPLVSSPRGSATQRGAGEVHLAARFSEKAVRPEGSSDGAEADALAMEVTRLAEEEAAAAEAASEAARAEAETASAEKAEESMRALREAEEAAHAATAEAKRRRFEEEASARAARKAESEARKALWRAEEAQRMKEQTGSKAADEAAAVYRIAQEEAELARRQATAARMEKAKNHLTCRLLSDEGLRVQKHGRNGKSAYRTLECPDDTCTTLTWGKKLHDLRTMQEVRTGTEIDPAYPGETGTSVLRRSKTASAAMERSFSLLFPSRSLDFTAASMDECEQLVLGFRALLTSQRRGSDVA